MKKNKQNGFTLIELLIAIAIFSTIAVTSYSSLNNFNIASLIQQQKIKKIENLQTLMIFLDRDFSQIFNQNLTLDKNQITISSLQNDKLTNISYNFNEKKIIRVKEDSSLVLLEDIDKVKIRVLSNTGIWSKVWRKNEKTFLKAIEFKFNSEFGEIIKAILINE